MFRLHLILLAAVAGTLVHAQDKTTDDIVMAPGLEDKNYIAPLQDALTRVDPSKDGWESEAISAAASTQLKELVHFIEDITDPTPLADLADDSFRCGPLFPSEGIEIFKRGALLVNRMTDPPKFSDQTHHDASGLEKAIRNWFAATGIDDPDAHPHAKLKLYRIAPGDDQTATARVLCTVTGHVNEARRQLNATWTCGWKLRGDDPPLLTSITVETYEEVTSETTNGEPLLVDATAAIMGANASYRDQLLRGTDHWRARIPRDFGLDTPANHGLAMGDINGDGLEDLYICQQGGLPNRLYLQNPDGTLTDFTEESQTGWLDYCASALIIDLDNDGDKDLVVSQDFRILFLDNLDGQGHFELAFGISTKAQTFTMTAADVDEDGFLDVYSCGYNPSTANTRAGAMGEPTPFHDANNGGINFLWRNLGNWEFEDITATVGLDVDNTRFSFAASFEDYDNDGDLDLYVANDYGRNCLYRNDGKGLKFTQIAAELKLEDTSAGMSTNWADFNRDGWMDLYISNMFSSAGNRITFQPQFQTDTTDDVRTRFQRMARGNTLYQADGQGGFTDVSMDMDVWMGRWAWSSAFVDLNNDGWEDILVANGFITTDDTGDL